MIVVVWANLLHQAIVCAVEGNVDADDLKRLGTNPGHVALNLLLKAGLGRIVIAQRGALAAIHLFVVHAAVEDLGVLRVDHALALQVKLHGLDRWHQADRDVTLACGVMAEVDTERAVAVIHNLSRDQQVEPHGLDIGIEVSPAEHLLELARLYDGPAFNPRTGGIRLEQVTAQHFPELLFRKFLLGKGDWGTVGQLQRAVISSSALTVNHPAAQGSLPAQEPHHLGGDI